MKASVFPTIILMVGFAVFVLTAMIGMQYDDIWHRFGALAIGVGFLSLMYSYAFMLQTAHIEKILKKHGLWQDEEIKKKDLKGDAPKD